MLFFIFIARLKRKNENEQFFKNQFRVEFLFKTFSGPAKKQKTVGGSGNPCD
jgi:hypothetical protein